jgi:hypothetical protein
LPRELPDLAPPFALADRPDGLRPLAAPLFPAPLFPAPLDLAPPRLLPPLDRAAPEPRPAPPFLALPGGGVGSITSGDSSL